MLKHQPCTAGSVLHESAVFFEIRLPPPSPPAHDSPPIDPAKLSEAFDDRLWFSSKKPDPSSSARRTLSDYSKLHAQIMGSGTQPEDRRVIVMDQRAGGLGNRLGAILSGLLLGILTDRALIVYWDLTSYLEDGNVKEGGIKWQYGSEEEARHAVLGDGADWPRPYHDIGELADALVCRDSPVLESNVVHITTPHYLIPLLAANPFFRRRIYDMFGHQPSHYLFNYLFTLVPRLRKIVDATRQAFTGASICLQMRCSRDCGLQTRTGDLGGQVR